MKLNHFTQTLIVIDIKDLYDRLHIMGLNFILYFMFLNRLKPTVVFDFIINKNSKESREKT